MVMKIRPKWKMDSAAELAVKNWYVQKKSKNDPLTGSRFPGVGELLCLVVVCYPLKPF